MAQISHSPPLGLLLPGVVGLLNFSRFFRFAKDSLGRVQSIIHILNIFPQLIGLYCTGKFFNILQTKVFASPLFHISFNSKTTVWFGSS